MDNGTPRDATTDTDPQITDMGYGPLPCPFCGSDNLRESQHMFAEDDGEHPGIECIGCAALTPLSVWNQRA